MTAPGEMSAAELAAHVQHALRAEGIEVVLSGGSCVTVWSDNAYRSDDIDELRRWSRGEGKAEAFEGIVDRLRLPPTT